MNNNMYNRMAHRPNCVKDSNDDQHTQLLCDTINQYAFHLNKLIWDNSHLTKITKYFKQNDADAIRIQNDIISRQNTSLDELKHNFPKLLDEIKICEIKDDEQNQYENLLSNYEHIIKKLDNEYQSMFLKINRIRDQVKINKTNQVEQQN